MNVSLSSLLLVVIAMTQSSFAQDIGRVEPRAVDVSLVQILVNSAKWDQKTIRVMGVYYWDREGSYLFLSKDHYSAFDTASALELAVAEKYLPAKPEEMAKFNGRMILLEGVLHAADPTSGKPLLMPISRIMVREEEDGRRQK